MSFAEILDSFALGQLNPDDPWKIGIEALLEGSALSGSLWADM